MTNSKKKVQVLRLGGVMYSLVITTTQMIWRERGKELPVATLLNEINKLLNKLPLILLCTIRIDDSLFNCRILPQQGCDGATGHGTWVPHPFGYNTERPWSFRKASSRLRV